MTVIDMVTRVDAICKKYDKYDVDKLRDNNRPNTVGDDVFSRFLFAVETDLDQAIQKSDSAVAEKSRATAVAMNAEVRRTKARLLEEILKLERLAFKKVKGLTKEELEARSDQVTVLKERIEALYDGSTTSDKQASSSSYTGIKFNSFSGGNFNSEYFRETEESSKYREEYEMRKMKQDEGLDVIAEGLDTLKNMAGDLDEEFDRQEPLMDEIDDKVDKAASDLKSTNVRLKDTVTQLRSSRNFCVDIILLCIILGIAAYLYNVLK